MCSFSRFIISVQLAKLVFWAGELRRRTMVAVPLFVTRTRVKITYRQVYWETCRQVDEPVWDRNKFCQSTYNLFPRFDHHNLATGGRVSVNTEEKNSRWFVWNERHGKSWTNHGATAPHWEVLANRLVYKNQQNQVTCFQIRPLSEHEAAVVAQHMFSLARRRNKPSASTSSLQKNYTIQDRANKLVG